MKRLLLSSSRTLCGSLLAASLTFYAGASSAATILSENFDATGFAGGNPFTHFSDRFGSTKYQSILNINGWTFAGQVFWATKVGSTDSAVLLNEGDSTNGVNGFGRASYTLNGLTVGQSYNLQFLLSGDNIPNSAYGLNTFLDNTLLLSSTGVDGDSVNLVPGSLKSVDFVATATSSVLHFQAFYENGRRTGASPIIDNILVTTADAPTSRVPEPASLALLGAGLLGASVSRRKRKPN